MTKEYTFYRIVCKNPEITDTYVGSTTQFRNRKFYHKSTCNNENRKDYNINVYQFIRDNGGWDNFEMIEIERLNFETKQEAHKRERYWLEFFNANLNKIIPTRSDKEYYDDNKQIYKKYYETNKEKINGRKKEDRQNNKEMYKEKDKQKYEKHKEQILQRVKAYYDDNKEEIQKRRSEPIGCICGSVVRRAYIKIHEQSLKHLNYLEQQNIK